MIALLPVCPSPLLPFIALILYTTFEICVHEQVTENESFYILQVPGKLVREDFCIYIMRSTF